MSRYTTLLVLVVGLLTGCDASIQPPIPEPPDRLAVYSAVTARDSSQYAVVTRPRPADERSTQYVQDATVEMDGHPLTVVPEDSIPFGGYDPLTPPGDRPANYETDSLYIEPGETVRLRVTTDAHEVTGTVQVPGAFTGTVDSMTVHWRSSAGAKLYKVRVRRYEEGDVEWEYVTTTDDTTTSIPKESERYNASFEKGPHEILITAVDSNLVKYQDNETRRSGIEGGYGFFGAVTRIGAQVELPATSEKAKNTNAVRLRPFSTQRGEGTRRCPPPANEPGSPPGRPQAHGPVSCRIQEMRSSSGASAVTDESARRKR